MMLKRFFTHPLLKKITVFSFILFGVLYAYHVVRYYIVKPDCDYILSTLNQSLEATLAFVSIATAVFTITQLVAGIIVKKAQPIVISSVAFLTLAGLFLLFMSNVILECFLHDLDLSGLFLFN